MCTWCSCYMSNYIIGRFRSASTYNLEIFVPQSEHSCIATVEFCEREVLYRMKRKRRDELELKMLKLWLQTFRVKYVWLYTKEWFIVIAKAFKYDNVAGNS